MLPVKNRGVVERRSRSTTPLFLTGNRREMAAKNHGKY